MDYKNLTEQELVNLFVDGDQSALKNLFTRHKKRVYTYILMVVKDKELAEDIFQDTFIKVIKSLKKGCYMEKGIFVSWVIRISHNLIIDHFRKLKHLKMLSSDQSDVNLLNSKNLAESNIEDNMIQNHINAEIRELINLLPADQKEVILLRHYGDMSFKEIAEQTGVSINTALGRMRYALINLRKMIEDKKLALTII